MPRDYREIPAKSPSLKAVSLEFKGNSIVFKKVSISTWPELSPKLMIWRSSVHYKLGHWIAGLQRRKKRMRRRLIFCCLDSTSKRRKMMPKRTMFPSKFMKWEERS